MSVGWAKRSVPTLNRRSLQWWARRKSAFAHPISLQLFALRLTLCLPRGGERFGSVDVEEGAVAFDRQFDHGRRVPHDQMTAADIAVERGQFVEETARPQHGIAALVVADGHRDQMAAVRRQ